MFSHRKPDNSEMAACIPKVTSSCGQPGLLKRNEPTKDCPCLVPNALSTRMKMGEQLRSSSTSPKPCHSVPPPENCSTTNTKDQFYQAIAAIAGGFFFDQFVVPPNWFYDSLLRWGIGAFLADALYLAAFGTEKELKCLMSRTDYAVANPVDLFVGTVLAAGTLMWGADLIDLGEILDVAIGFSDTDTFFFLLALFAMMTTNLGEGIVQLKLAVMYTFHAIVGTPSCELSSQQGFKTHNRSDWFDMDPSKWKDVAKSWENFLFDVGDVFIGPIRSIYEAFSSLDIFKILMFPFSWEGAYVSAIAQVIYDFGRMIESIKTA